MTQMLSRWALTLSLALMFALSQQGALVHEISHFRDYTNSTSQPDNDGDGDGKADSKNTAGHFCAKCAAFSALASTVGVHAFIPPLLANSFETVVYSTSSHTSSTFLSYAARAPPVVSSAF